jgi:hypothetical protein
LYNFGVEFKLYLMKNPLELIRQVIPLWYANMAWAKALLIHAFNLKAAEDILRVGGRGGRHQIPGTNWFYRTHGIGVDIYKTPGVGGIDFDFDKPDPDAWRFKIFFEKQINEGSLTYADYQELVEDEELLKNTIKKVLGET